MFYYATWHNSHLQSPVRIQFKLACGTKTLLDITSFLTQPTLGLCIRCLLLQVAASVWLWSCVSQPRLPQPLLLQMPSATLSLPSRWLNGHIPPRYRESASFISIVLTGTLPLLWLLLLTFRILCFLFYLYQQTIIPRKVQIINHSLHF